MSLYFFAFVLAPILYKSKFTLTSDNELSIMLFRIQATLEALFKVRKPHSSNVFFLRVCSKQSYCFAFLIMKPLFTAGGRDGVKCQYIERFQSACRYSEF